MDFVKKMIFGIAVMTLGSLGAIALLFGTFVAEPILYNGVGGWLGCFLVMKIRTNLPRMFCIRS